MPEGRVLFVDDEAPLRHAVQQGLELCGHNVTCFARARQAEAQLSRELYGVLVSDIRMPAMDGCALLRRAEELDHSLRSDEHTSELQSLMRITADVFCLTKKK